MKVKKSQWICALLILLLLGFALYLSDPQLRVERFVMHHGEELAQAYSPDGTAGPIPADIGIVYANPWKNPQTGEYDMLEFILFARGNTYYGCYYSPNDVPLGFQNVPVELKQDDQDRWIWTGEGDNNGVTIRIAENWYYFEAEF